MYTALATNTKTKGPNKAMAYHVSATRQWATWRHSQSWPLNPWRTALIEIAGGVGDSASSNPAGEKSVVVFTRALGSHTTARLVRAPNTPVHANMAVRAERIGEAVTGRGN